MKDDVTNLHTNREIMHLTQTDRHDQRQLADDIFQSDKSSHQVSKAKPNLSAGHKSIIDFLIPANTIIFRGQIHNFNR